MRSLLIRCGYVAAVLLVIGYAFYALRGPHGVPALMEKREEIRALEKTNQDLARDIEQKRERIQRLRDNQSEQELEIRQRLKLVRPGEKVFILQDPEKKTAKP